MRVYQRVATDAGAGDYLILGGAGRAVESADGARPPAHGERSGAGAGGDEELDGKPVYAVIDS